MDDTSRSLLDRLRDSTDQASWQRLIDLYTPWLHGWLRRCQVPQADAEDFVQEVLTVVANEVRDFHHNERPGAFRRWLRAILSNRLKGYWRQQQTRTTTGTDSMLTMLEDPTSDLDRIWDREHDDYVTRRLLELIEPDFAQPTWLAFRRQMIDDRSAADVAAEMGITPNAALIAKSRVLRRLRVEANGLTD